MICGTGRLPAPRILLFSWESSEKSKEYPSKMILTLDDTHRTDYNGAEEIDYPSLR